MIDHLQRVIRIALVHDFIRMIAIVRVEVDGPFPEDDGEDDD